MRTIKLLIFLAAFLLIATISSAKDFAVLNNATILLNASGGTGNVILVPGTGNVSIGASAPAAKLHVGGDALIDNKSAVVSTTWTDVQSGTMSALWNLAVYNGQLYAVEASNVYRYDGGTTWTDVMGSPATISTGMSLAVYNGQLYAGDNSGNVYRYDGGTTWTDIASTGSVRNLAVYNGQLYIIEDAGVANVYRYDGGTTWTDVMGTPATVDNLWSFAVYNGQLYVGTDAGDIYRYDGGTTWTDIASITDYVLSLAVYNGQLYAGDNTGDIYRYDGGTTWTDIASLSVSGVYSLAVYNGQLYAGDEAGNIYRYDGGTTWTDVMGSPATTGGVRTFAVYNGQLYAGDSNGDIWQYSANPPQSYALKLRSENETASLWFQGNMSSGQGIEGQNQHGQFIFSHGIQTQSGAYDVAEEFPTYDTALEAGDIAVASLVNSEFIEKSTAPYQKNLIGVVSTKPAVVLKSDKTGDMRLISLAGRVPVKVSTENGIIQVGDYVTSSSIQGVGMKASKAGRIIGKALENFPNGEAMPCPQETPNAVCGKIKVLAKVSWYYPEAYSSPEASKGTAKALTENSEKSEPGHKENSLLAGLIGSLASIFGLVSIE